jgi:hypothetical protein
VFRCPCGSVLRNPNVEKATRRDPFSFIPATSKSNRQWDSALAVDLDGIETNELPTDLYVVWRCRSVVTVTTDQRPTK